MPMYAYVPRPLVRLRYVAAEGASLHDAAATLVTPGAPWNANLAWCAAAAARCPCAGAGLVYWPAAESGEPRIACPHTPPRCPLCVCTAPPALTATPAACW